jgi:hypothetical protein
MPQTNAAYWQVRTRRIGTPEHIRKARPSADPRADSGAGSGGQRNTSAKESLINRPSAG